MLKDADFRLYRCHCVEHYYGCGYHSKESCLMVWMENVSFHPGIRFGTTYDRARFLFADDRVQPIGLKPLFFVELEIGFAKAADRANPIVRNVFKRGSGFDSAVGIADGRIINVLARRAYIFFHRKTSILCSVRNDSAIHSLEPPN